MPRVEGELVIERPVEEVFDFVADERNEPRFNPRMLRSEKISPGPIGLGTRFRAEMRMRGRGRPVVMTVEFTAFERPRRLASSTHMATMDIDGAMTFDPVPEGTRMRWEWDLKPRGLVNLLSPVIVLMGRRQEPQRRYTEKRPFDSWEELYALADRLGPSHGPVVLFAAATGLRPGEWLALEQRDVDREAQVVYVRRTFRNGRIKTPKTKASVRAVPLQAIALAALDELRRPDPECPLLFSSASGGYFDLHNFRNRSWRPAQKAAGITPLRRVYDLRHTFATFALRSGISTFDLSRYMGTGLAIIDRHYGHLARDGRQHAISLLDTYRAGEAADVHAVGARWTLNDVSDAAADNGKGG